MAEVFKRQPGDSVDLHHSLATDGTTSNESQDVRCFVTNPNGSAVSGSPFKLTHEARGSYVKRGAYSSDIIGVYREEYIIYTSYPGTENLNYERKVAYIDTQYEALGVAGGGGLSMSALSELLDEIPRKVWRYDTSAIKNKDTAIRQILDSMDIELPEDKTSQLISAINEIPGRVPVTKFDDSHITKKLDQIYSKKIEIPKFPIAQIIGAIDKIKSKIPKVYDEKKLYRAVADFRDLVEIYNEMEIQRTNSPDRSNGIIDVINQFNQQGAVRIRLAIKDIKKYIDKNNGDQESISKILKKLNEKPKKKYRFSSVD